MVPTSLMTHPKTAQTGELLYLPDVLTLPASLNS